MMLYEETQRFQPVIRYANRLACRPGETFGPRVIEDYQWIYVEQGEGEITIHGERFPARAGSLFTYGPGVPHQLTANEDHPFVLYGLHFLPDGELIDMTTSDKIRIKQISPSQRNSNSNILSYHDHSIIALPPFLQTGSWPLPYFQDMVKEYNLIDGYAPLYLRSLLAQLFVRLHRWIAVRREQTPLDQIVSDIKQMLEQRAEQTYEMKWLTQCKGYSHDYSSKLFKERIGSSPHAYHQQMKLIAAQKYLMETHMTITNISTALQFGSIHYFCKWFKRMTGESPSSYRSKTRII